MEYLIHHKNFLGSLTELANNLSVAIIIIKLHTDGAYTILTVGRNLGPRYEMFCPLSKVYLFVYIISLTHVG